MQDPTGATCRLLAACACSYAIGSPGGAQGSPQYAAAGFLRPPQELQAGAERHDGCLVGETEAELVLAYRGTIPLNFRDLASVVDWIADFSAQPVRVPGLPGLLHDGFQRSVALLEAGVVGALRPLLASGKPLWITGHSKGAAMGPIAAARLHERHQIETRALRLFAPPRPGNEPFARYLAHIAPDTLRYEYQDDLVPHVPPSAAWIELLAKFPGIGREFRRLTGWHYAPVGSLQFIDWQRELRPDSPELEAERTEHLARLLVELRFERIADDHSLLASYTPALCPTLVG